MTYEFFISYRRENNGDIQASHLYEVLVSINHSNHNVFLDREEITEGRFDSQIKTAIENTNKFVIIVTPTSFKHKSNNVDWYYKEIAYALEKVGVDKMTIIKFGDFSKYKIAEESLPECLQNKNFTKIQQVSYNPEYRRFFRERLIYHFYKWKDYFFKEKIIYSIFYFICFFSISFLTGSIVGFIQARESSQINIESAFNRGKIKRICDTVIKYEGEHLVFTYNLQNEQIVFEYKEFNTQANNLVIFISTVSYSAYFKKLLKNSRGLKGQSVIIYWVVGTFAVLTGYPWGNKIGEDYAKTLNENDIYHFFNNYNNRERIKKFCDDW